MRSVLPRLAWVALLAATLSSGHAARAAACTCPAIEGRVLLPSASKLAPASGPWLVLRPPGEVPSLRTEKSVPVPIEIVRSFSALSLCPRSFALVRPVTPLEDGAFYQLVIGWSGGVHGQRFKATARAPKRVDRWLHVRLERKVVDLQMVDVDCAPTKLEPAHAKGHFVTTLEADAPALLFLEVSAEDTSFGSLAEGNATLSGDEASQLALSTSTKVSIPELDTTAACARVVVRDALDGVVYDQVLCPEPGKSLAADLPVSIPEHVIRAESPAEDSGCALGRERGHPFGHGSTALSVLAMALWLSRKRRRSVSRLTAHASASTLRRG